MGDVLNSSLLVSISDFHGVSRNANLQPIAYNLVRSSNQLYIIMSLIIMNGYNVQCSELIDNSQDCRVLRLMNYTGSIEVNLQEEAVSPTLIWKRYQVVHSRGWNVKRHAMQREV
jgi:hypothetical protein